MIARAEEQREFVSLFGRVIGFLALATVLTA